MYIQKIASRWPGQCITATVLVFTLHATAAHAVESGTPVSNSATVSFDVNTITQTPIPSNTASFVVDKKVDLTVTTSDTSAVIVTPGEPAESTLLEFLVTNTGNDAQYFNLSAITVPTTGSTRWAGANDDAFDANNPIAYIESGATVGYQVGQDATFINELLANAAQTVYITGAIPLGAANGQYASYHLVAEARASDGSALSNTLGAETPGIVDTVFADGAGSNDSENDARYSSQNDYIVASADISIIKTSSAFWDPVNINSLPKRIPGGRVEYTITVSNAAGASQATNITIVDDLTAENANIVYFADGYGSGQGISLSINGAPATPLTGIADGDDGTYDGASQDLSVSGITLNGGENAEIRFLVTIQ